MSWTPYQTADQFNITGMDNVFLYVATTIPSFIPFLLFAIGMVVTGAIYFGQKRATGTGDFPAAFSVGTWFVAIIATMMTLKEGLVNGTYLIICYIAAIAGIAVLYFSRER